MNEKEIEDLLAENDCYKILGIQKSASPDEMKKAYHKKMMAFHPDKIKDQNISVDRATAIAQHINSAKEALDEGCSELKNQEGKEDVIIIEPYQADQVFIQAFNAWTNQLILNATFGLLTGNSPDMATLKRWYDLMHPEDYCLGMNLSWIHGYINGHEAEAIQQYQQSLKSRSYNSVIQYMTYLHPYLKGDDFTDRVNHQSLKLSLNANIQNPENLVDSPVCLIWCFDYENFINLLIEQINLFHSVPYLIRVKQGDDKTDRCISLVFDGTHYKIFSPHEPVFTQSGLEVANVTEAQMREVIKSHFFKEDSNDKKIVELVNFVPRSLKAAPRGIPLNQTNFIRTMSENSASEADEHQIVLNMVKDWNIRGLLKHYIRDMPELVINETFQSAVSSKDWGTTIEIIQASEVMNRSYEFTRAALYYFYGSDYGTKNLSEDMKKIDVFLEMTEAFLKNRIDLKSILTEDDKKSTQWLTPLIKTMSKNLDKVHKVLDLGYVFTDEQTGLLAEYIAEGFNSIENRISIKNMNTYVRDSITLLDRMIASSYRFHQKDGLKSMKYLLDLIMGFWNIDTAELLKKETDPNKIALYEEKNQLHDHLVTLLKNGIKTGVFSLNAKDIDNHTLLNKATGLRKWDLILFLYECKAEYSTGENISSIHIPPMRASFMQIESLKSIYENMTTTQWLDIKTSHRDILADCLSNAELSLPALNFWLDYFHQQLKSNIIPYLMACNCETEKMDFVLKSSTLNPDSEPVQTVSPEPFSIDSLYQTFVETIHIEPNTLTVVPFDLSTIRNISPLDAAQQLSNAHQKSVTVFTADHKKFYLSWDSILEEALKFCMLYSLARQYATSIQEFESRSSAAVDVAQLIENCNLIQKHYVQELAKWKPLITYIPERPEYMRLTDNNSSAPNAETKPSLGIFFKTSETGMITDSKVIEKLSDLYRFDCERSDLVVNKLYLDSDSLYNVSHYIISRTPLVELLTVRTPLRFTQLKEPLLLDEFGKNYIENRRKAYQPLMNRALHNDK